MSVEIKPETERLVLEEIQRGHFSSIDDLIIQGLHALREKAEIADPKPSAIPPRKSLYDLLTQPPFAGSGLDLERLKELPRDIQI